MGLVEGDNPSRYFHIIPNYKTEDMKKVFLAAAIAISAVAIASTTQPQAFDNSVSKVYQDTVPGKKDTSKWPKPDTTGTLATTFQLGK